MVLVGALILAINFLPVASARSLVIGLLVVTVITLVLFVLQQRRAENPLYDLKVALRPTFWVAAVGGIIVFGALMQSIFGALLAAGYTTAITAALAATPGAASAPSTVTNELTMSYAGAMAVAKQYSQYADQIAVAAKTAFLAGDDQAYIAGIIAVLIGAALVFFLFPRRDEELELLVEFHQQDIAAAGVEPAAPEAAPPQSGD